MGGGTSIEVYPRGRFAKITNTLARRMRMFLLIGIYLKEIATFKLQQYCYLHAQNYTGVGTIFSIHLKCFLNTLFLKNIFAYCHV